MTDNELREAAGRVLGWVKYEDKKYGTYWAIPGGYESWEELPPLDWTTAGALLELCAERKADVTVDTGIDKHLDNGVFGPPEGFKRVRYGDVDAETVIEACVMALIDQHPPGCPHCGLEHWEND